MALIRWTPRRETWDPFASLAEVQEEMNRLFDTSLRRIGPTALEGAFSPSLDVLEEKDSIRVRADLPGMSKDDVNVSLEDNYLTIKGERRHETESKDANYFYRERVSGRFSRTIELPMKVDAKRIEAHFHDGVLNVVLPKSEEAKPKQIEVKVN